jgi:drug/metabolite transporter (DMT)-like permease
MAALAAVVFWGLSFVASKAALRELTPITLVFARFALGVLVLFALVAARRQLQFPARTALPMLLLMGFDGVFLHQMLQVHGLNLTTAVRTGWLIGLIPLWSALLSALLLREAFGARKIAGLVLGALGALLLVTRGKPSAELLALPSTRGDLLVVASTVNWALYTVLGNRLLKRLGSLPATAWSMLMGWSLFLPFFVQRAGWNELAVLSGPGVGAVLFLGICCSGLGYLFWYAALEKVEASVVASFLYLEPLVTFAAAVGLLHEPFTVSTLLGGAIVLAGVLLVQTAK